MAQKLRILLLIPHLGGGGAEKVAALLARGLSTAQSGAPYEVHLATICPSQSGQSEFCAEPLPPSVTLHTLGARRVRAGAFELVRLVRRLEPDVILSGMFHLNFLVLLLRPFFPRKARVLVRQNGTVSSALALGGVASGALPWHMPWYMSCYMSWYRRWYTRLLYRLTYRRADRIICQSQAMADDLCSELRIHKDRIAVLPNPVDFEGIDSIGGIGGIGEATCACSSGAAAAATWSGPGPHLLAVGRLVPEKGFDLLLDAFAVVRERFPHAQLLIAGAGPEEAALKARCAWLGLETAVRFTGYVQRPYDLYAGASLFVLSSRHEAMPNALLEAVVAGLPIVATAASGGIVDLLQTLDGAWLAQEISATALAAALLEALDRLGPAPAPRFHRSFTGEFAFASAIERYVELIDTVCAPVCPPVCPRRDADHLAVVIPTLDRIGGAERHAMLLAHGLRRRGWRVSVVALSGTGGGAAKELADAGVRFVSLEMRKGLADPRGWLRFLRWLRREKPDVVHAHLPHAAWLARWSRVLGLFGLLGFFRLFAPSPILVDTLHSASTGTWGRRWGYRFSRRLPHRVIAVSRSVAGSHLAAGMVRREALTILHNGVDVDEWRPDEAARAAMRQELGLTNEFLWIAAGRLETVKDYPTLLQALASTPPHAQLVIAGDGPLRQHLTELASNLYLVPRIRFLGFVADPRRWFQAADGCVLSSRWEGLPMALIEAAACGLPTVATNVPGSRDVIRAGETGLLVPPGEPSALAAAMNTLMRMPADERRAMGQRARQRAVEQFNLALTIDQCAELYRGLLEKRPRRSRSEPAPSKPAGVSAIASSKSS